VYKLVTLERGTFFLRYIKIVATGYMPIACWAIVNSTEEDIKSAIFRAYIFSDAVSPLLIPEQVLTKRGSGEVEQRFQFTGDVDVLSQSLEPL